MYKCTHGGHVRVYGCVDEEKGIIIVLQTNSK